MPEHDIVVIGASAGGIETITELARGLSPDLPAAVFAVIHIGSQSPNVLPGILNRNGSLPVIGAEDDAPIVPGRLYVAPPDYHLLLGKGRVHTLRGPRENNVRPAIDPLFRSAALVYGPRVIGVLLSGNLDDGTAGLKAIKRLGGITVVQDPDDAMFPGMPRSAIENVQVDYVVTLAQLPALIEQLVAQHAPGVEQLAAHDRMEIEDHISKSGIKFMSEMNQLGKPSLFTCPECGGTLFEVQDENLTRFRCHTGHAFSLETLDAQQMNAIEEALWAALRTLQESITLSQRIAERAREHHKPALADKFEAKAQQAQERCNVIKEFLANKN